MHRQHRIGVGSLAGYIGKAMDGLPIHHAFIIVGKSFDIPAILFYQQEPSYREFRHCDESFAKTY
jgi:hypothetical protein